MLLNFKAPIGNSIYKTYDQQGIKLVTRLKLGLSHLSEHKFRDKFADSLNPLVLVLYKLSLHFICFYTAKIILLYTEHLWLIQNV